MHHATRARVAAAPPIRGTAAERPRCLLAARHPESGLLRALRRVIAEELPSIEFVLDDADAPPGPPPEAVWICGYETGDVELVRGLRARHPGARLLVTRCGGIGWTPEVLAAGADAAEPWPMPLGLLEDLLRA